MKYQGKVCIVTGAGSGLGKAAAEEIAAGGGKMVLSDIAEEAGRQISDELNDGGAETIFVKADASNEDDVERLVREAVDRFGSVDIMVPNAGINAENARATTATNAVMIFPYPPGVLQGDQIWTYLRERTGVGRHWPSPWFQGVRRRPARSPDRRSVSST